MGVFDDSVEVGAFVGAVTVFETAPDSTDHVDEVFPLHEASMRVVPTIRAEIVNVRRVVIK